MKVKITLTGTDGSQEKTVKVAETGATVAEICKAGKIDTANKDLTVNGKPATLETHVDKAATVEVSARPQGS